MPGTMYPGFRLCGTHVLRATLGCDYCVPTILQMVTITGQGPCLPVTHFLVQPDEAVICKSRASQQKALRETQRGCDDKVRPEATGLEGSHETPYRTSSPSHRDAQQGKSCTAVCRITTGENAQETPRQHARMCTVLTRSLLFPSVS